MYAPPKHTLKKIYTCFKSIYENLINKNLKLLAKIKYYYLLVLVSTNTLEKILYFTLSSNWITFIKLLTVIAFEQLYSLDHGWTTYGRLARFGPPSKNCWPETCFLAKNVNAEEASLRFFIIYYFENVFFLLVSKLLPILCLFYYTVALVDIFFLF